MGKGKYDTHSERFKPREKNYVAEILAEVTPLPGRRTRHGFIHALDNVQWLPCVTRKIGEPEHKTPKKTKLEL